MFSWDKGQFDQNEGRAWERHDDKGCQGPG